MKYIECLLLKLIQSNSSVSLLRSQGLSYSQIVLLIQEQVEKGYLTYEGPFVKITNAGENALSLYYKDNHFKTKDTWILPDLGKRTEPISRSKIFLPKKM